MVDDGFAASAYDRIAHLYDVDMALNMRFDDVGFYVRVAAHHGGRVLELGCGNGRILLELMTRGIEAVGIDESAKMLKGLADKAAARGLPLRACRMDALRLAFGVRFDVVLCPYSLVTYMAKDDAAARFLDGICGVLAPRGIVVVDAFVPRPLAQAAVYTRDYVRPHNGLSLVRSKRITQVAPNVNHIERRYELIAADGSMNECIETREDIRAFAPAELLALLEERGLRARETWWNYASTAEIADAQFFTAIAAAA